MKTLTLNLILFYLFTFASAQIQFVPESIEFGPTTVNETYSLDVQIFSSLAQDITLGGLDTPFSVSDNTLTFENDGDSQTITVFFDPTFPDLYSGTLSAIGLTDFNTADLAISGEGTLVDIVLSTDMIDFDEVTIGTNATLSFDISNVGTGTMLVSDIVSNDEQYTTDFSEFNLANGESNTINVTFTPSIAGDNDAVLSIYTNDPNDNPALLNITGIGKTDISGNVIGTWIPENNPYHIVGTVTIADGEELIIDPGVEVIFDGDYTINVYGSLIMVGTAQDSITFMSNYNATMEFNDPDSDPNFEFVRFITERYSPNNDFESNSVTNTGLYHTDSGSFYVTENSYEGNYALEMHYNGGNTSYYQRVYTPYYKVNDDSKEFSFALYTDYSSSCNYHFKVYLRVNNQSTHQLYYEDCENLTWREIEFDYSEFVNEGDNVQFYFENQLYDWTTIRIDNLEISGVEDGFFKDGVNLRFTGSEAQDITLSNSSIFGSNTHGIYTSSSYKSINLFSSKIEMSEDQGIHIYDSYSPVSITDSKISNNDDYGIYNRTSYSPIYIESSEISNNGSYGARTDASYSEIVVNNSVINGNNASGLYTDDTWTPITVTNSEISDNNGYGVHASSSNSQVYIENSVITDNNGYGVYNGSSGDLIVSRSLIARNEGYGLRSNSAPAQIDYCTIVDNRDHGFYSNSNYFYEITNSIFWNNDWDNYHRQIYNSGYMTLSYNNIEGVLNPQGTGNSYGIEGNTGSDNTYYGPGLIGSDPQFSDSDYYYLLDSSPSVDAAHPDNQDSYMPPGLGLVRADQGVYGGPGNDYWGGSPLPENGSAVINNVSDLPQDEGGFVGIQYDGSIYDYGHSGYNISYYSFWRLMDLDRDSEIDASGLPNGQYFSMSRDEYWEHVGDMDAQEHAQYGYSAPTLADSTEAGTFLSTYIVIAHTDDESVYFTSESATGYSVDNLAPLAPQLTSLEIDIDGINIVWEPSEALDLLYYSVHRDGEHLLDLTELEFTDSSTPYGSFVEYYITATDVHGNISEPSETLSTYANVPGDVNQDQSLNVIDLILIVDYILDPENSNFDEIQLNIADHNGDGEINIIDIVALLNIIVDNSGVGRTMSDGVELIVRENSISHKSEALVGYQITLSHAAGMNISLTENALIADINTIGSTTMIIIVNPEPGVLMSTDGDFEIVDILAASGDKSINVNIIDIPNQFTLKNAYPNPFNPETTIQYGLPDISSVKVSIYDVHGRLVEELADGVMDAGYHSLTWNGNMVASGVYLVQIQTPYELQTQKIMLLK